MKKILFVFAFLMLISTAALAEEAALPTFDVTLNGQKIESANREYPLLVYRDITYFPMTYYDCRFLGLSTDWDGNSRTLGISKENIGGMYRDYASMEANKKSQTVELCRFGIVINGKVIRNIAEQYPLVTFRGVTYFPLTWRFAHDEFGWEYSYTDKDGLVINSDNYHAEILDLPDAATDGTLAVGTDGEYYYYKGNENKIYRTPVEDISKNELIYTIPKGGKEYVYVDFYMQNDELFVKYNNGYNARSADNYFKIVDGKMVETDEGNQSNIAAGNRKQYDLGHSRREDSSGLIVKTHDMGYTLDMTVEYVYNGATHEIKKDGVVFGVYENDGKPERSECFYRMDTYRYIDGRNVESSILYLNGYDTEKEISDLYMVDIETGEITKVLEDVGYFYANYWGSSGQTGAKVIFWRDGQLLQYIDSTEKVSVMMDSPLPMKEAVDGWRLVVALSDVGRDVTLVDFGYYGDMPGTVLFHTDSSAVPFVNNGMIGVRVVEDLPGSHVHFAAVDPGHMPYFSADFADTCFYNDRVLLYTTEGKAVKVELRRKY